MRGQLLMDSVSTILATLDSAITSAGRQYFEATAGAIGPLHTSLLTLLLVMVGINAALNVYRISMRDAVQLSFRIVMVLMFGLTWSNFTQIYEAASNGLSALALEYFRLGGSGVGASATAAMDDMANIMAGEEGGMGYGIRVVLVMNRKGGSGKSTLYRALASAAATRGETVTIFDTDASKSCLKWMQAGKEAGNWSPLVEVIHTLDAHRVAEAIGQIYEQPDQEHLILIDTFGGGSEAQDVLAVAAHQIICPMMLSRGDLSETLETANWYLKLRGRVEKPDELAGFSVLLNRVPVRVSETERAVAEELFQSLPALETYLGSRAAYVPMDREGLLGVIADKTPNRALAAHVQSAVKEAADLLEEIDQLILNPAEIA